MATKKTIRGRASARKLAGAVVLTASFSLFAIPDALAESGGGQCVSTAGPLDGFNLFSDGGAGGSCSAPEVQASIEDPSSLGGY